MSVAIIDYGSGNLHSVAKAFEHVGTPIAQTAELVCGCAVRPDRGLVVESTEVRPTMV